MRRSRRLLHQGFAVPGAMVIAMAGGGARLGRTRGQRRHGQPRCVVDDGIRDTVSPKPIRHRRCRVRVPQPRRHGRAVGPSGVRSCTMLAPRCRRSKLLRVQHVPGNSTTEAQLRTAGAEGDLQVAPSVTVDGQSVPVTEVETQLLNIVLPPDNIFGLPAGMRGLSVAHGWVALLHPLPPGTHAIVIHSAGSPDITTKIIVKPGH